jgi:hypothetical protein
MTVNVDVIYDEDGCGYTPVKPQHNEYDVYVCIPDGVLDWIDVASSFQQNASWHGFSKYEITAVREWVQQLRTLLPERILR